MNPKCTQNAPKNPIKDCFKYIYFLKNPDIAISLNCSLVHAGALGALGRRFESCRPDS